MWYCTECDNIFENPAVYEEDPSPRGICLPPGRERYLMCPICGSEYIEEVDEDEYDEDDLWFEG
jgi:hypothetical protein